MNLREHYQERGEGEHGFHLLSLLFTSFVGHLGSIHARYEWRRWAKGGALIRLWACLDSISELVSLLQERRQLWSSVPQPTQVQKSVWLSETASD